MAQTFKKSFDLRLRVFVPLGLLCLGAVALGAIYLGLPSNKDAGYRPEQPVEYSHKLHAGNLGIDCRYCHNTVDRAAFAAVPTTETCMNCHHKVKTNSSKLTLVRESYGKGESIPWVKVHVLPDYVYFNHQAHVTRGVSCVSCHGRVDQMIKVTQVAPLSMGWCLDCHRNPAPNVRPVEFVTKLDWQPDRPAEEIGRELIAQKGINPPVDCAGCHR
ncbi:MAG: cytochrome c family protein [Bryobacterales bacterium]|nr:cytochrome c family protein [Bryobacterales bacterium]